MQIDIQAACNLLREHDRIVILAHQKPDGDTFGASFALLWALLAIGKQARVECPDGFSTRYAFIYGDYRPDESFEPEFVVAADVAGTDLLGALAEKYAGRIDLCIDHHKSNTMYAKYTLLDAAAPAASQIVCEVIAALGVPFDKNIANAVFTGLSTDTGCFKYSNVTSKTMRIAAEMIDRGAQHAIINKLMFDTKSRGLLMVERMMMETICFYFDGRCALVFLPADITRQFGVTEDELDGVSAFSVRIEGVYAGVTIRAKENGTYRVSLRTVSPVDASRVCGLFSGGGHANAAGCTMSGDLDDVTNRLLQAVEDELKASEAGKSVSVIAANAKSASTIF